MSIGIGWEAVASRAAGRGRKTIVMVENNSRLQILGEILLQKKDYWGGKEAVSMCNGNTKTQYNLP